MQPTYWAWEGELSAEDCQKIIDAHFVEGSVEDGMFGKNGGMVRDDTMRKTDVAWALVGSPVFDTIYNYITSANKNVWNYDLSGMEPVQLAKYQDGGHYTWHADLDDPCSENFQRKLSCSVQLSDEDDYVGGDLLFQTAGNEEHKAPRKRGSIIVFSGMLKHKVTPVTSGTRFSAVAWMRGPAFR